MPQQPTISPTTIPTDLAEKEQKDQDQEEKEQRKAEKTEQKDQDGKSLNVFCYAALADKIEGTMYTDVTGALPHRSLEGNLYYLIAYIHDMNAILARPIKSTKSEDIVDPLECPQKLIHRYEGSDWVTNFAVGSFCGGSAANGTEAAHCEANSAGVKPPRPLCGRRWL